MPIRKNIIETGSFHHVFNKSIEHFKIFNSHADFNHFMGLVAYYKFKRKQKYSYYANHGSLQTTPEKLVQIIAYCIMPTHFHFILKSIVEDSVRIFIHKIADGYAKHFNLKHNRFGPLLQGRFKSVKVETDEQLLHLTRYLHLNPVSAKIVQKPENWKYSSYLEYLKERKSGICKYSDVLDIKPENYRKFVEDGIEKQRELAAMRASARNW